MIKLSGQVGVPFTYTVNDKGKGSGVLGYDVPTLRHLLGVK